MTKEKKQYEAPSLATVEFKMERGYAVSIATLDTDRMVFEYESSNPSVTQYEADNSWAGYDWN